MKALQRRYTVEQLREKFRADFAQGILYDKKTGRAILNRPNADGYLRVGIRDESLGKYKTYYVHDVLFYMNHGWLPEEIDHFNHVKSDNSENNLRESNHRLQQVNMPKKEGTTSLYKGVCHYPQKASKRWRASLCHRGKHVSFGYYETEEEAARAYDRAAYKIWGETSIQHMNFSWDELNYKKPYEPHEFPANWGHLME